MSEDHLKERLDKLLEVIPEGLGEGQAHFVLLRQDGIPLYEKPFGDDSTRSESNKTHSNNNNLSVLAAGAFNAAQAMRKELHFKDGPYYLNFSASDEGIFLCEAGDLIVCTAFSNLLSPAKLRRNIQVLAGRISDLWLSSEQVVKERAKKVLEKDEMRLFDDISDQEIDELFSDF